MFQQRPPRLAGVLLVGLLLAGPVRADDDDVPLFRLAGTPPAGFETLAAPQRGLVDVYYGNRPLISTMATFSAESITFDDLDELLAAVPDLANPEMVRLAFSGSLAPNSEFICSERVKRECDSLSPEVAGVIFNADRYRVDLFVASSYRTEGESPRRKFLEPSESGFSFVQNFTGNFAGTSRGSDGVTVSSFSTFAHRENRVVAIASYSDADDVTVDRLFARRDFEGKQYVGGLFRTAGRAPSFTGENDLLGLRMASTLETRTDLQQSRGTPIDLFLGARARVDIIKDGRLLSTRFYDAGNQILDTTMLPEGAYDITIRITENGVVREEEQFFTKTSRVPPKDQSLFVLEAGQVMRRDTADLFPEDTGAFLVRGGYSNRLTDNFGFDAGVAGTSDDQMLEAGISLGGEQSGHIVDLRHSTTGDGLATALQIARKNDLSTRVEHFKKVRFNTAVHDDPFAAVGKKSQVVHKHPGWTEILHGELMHLFRAVFVSLPVHGCNEPPVHTRREL